MSTNDKYQLWLITGAAADSPDVRSSAKAAISGIKKLFRHPRLSGRVIAYFAALEVAHKEGRAHPCVHVHVLAVTRPMDKGKYRISREDWIKIWEEACPQHRQRSPTSVNFGPREHVSLDARQVSRKDLDVLRVIKYVTKWAGTKVICTDYRKLLTPDPAVFLERIAALKGIPRFFGKLHKSQRPQDPTLAELPKAASAANASAQEDRAAA